MDGRLKDESELTQKVSLKKCQDIDRLVKNGVCLVSIRRVQMGQQAT